MNLPTSIENLLKQGTIESERIEYKSGWNPEPIMKTICAFANDFRDLGGGYIVIGVEEEDGIPVLPPKGLNPRTIDKIQKELVHISKFIEPNYVTIATSAQYEERTLFVIYCPGGNLRPYRCPIKIANKTNKAYYIRQHSSTVKANQDQELELIRLNQRIPFDDLINMRSSISDLDLGLIRSFLGKVKSDLFESSASMLFEDLLKRMNLVERTHEKYYPKNVALMFFNPEPQWFFPYTQVDVVHFPDGLGGDKFSETSFKGPIDQMLINALNHIKSRYILEHVQKVPGVAEAIRLYNYPYQAIEEALCNAVYHRSYEVREPIEVRILPDKITIHSIPGPDVSVTEEEIKGLDFTSRRYRNRRIGEYLKELKLTEGRGTGMPKIIRACQNNGSPMPIIHTNPDRTFFMFELSIHPAYKALNEQVPDQVSDQVLKLLILLKDEPLSRKELMDKLKLVHAHSFRELYLLPSMNAGYVVMTIPDKPRSINQKYSLSPLGLNILIRLVKNASHTSEKI